MGHVGVLLWLSASRETCPRAGHSAGASDELVTARCGFAGFEARGARCGRTSRFQNPGKSACGTSPFSGLAVFARDLVHLIVSHGLGNHPAARHFVYLLDPYKLVVRQRRRRLLCRKGLVVRRRFIGEGHRRIRMPVSVVDAELSPRGGCVVVSPFPSLVLIIPDDLTTYHAQYQLVMVDRFVGHGSSPPLPLQIPSPTTRCVIATQSPDKVGAPGVRCEAAHDLTPRSPPWRKGRPLVTAVRRALSWAVEVSDTEGFQRWVRRQGFARI